MLSQSLIQKQTVTQSVTQTIKFNQSLMLKTSIKELRGCFYPPEDNIEVIENMIKIFLGNIKDIELKEFMEGTFDTKEIKEMISDEAILLSVPKKTNIDHFIHKYLFQLIIKMEESGNSEKFIDKEDMFKKADEGDFIKAFTDNKKLLQEIETLKNIISIGNSQISKEFKTKNKIVNLVDEDMLQIADTMAQSLHFLLTTKITKEENEKKNTEKNILDFLREKVILEQVSDFSSERLLKRFLYKFPSFQTKNQINNCRDLKSRTINTIGEFILISLGIISPKMFKLYNFSIEPEKIDDLIKNTDYTREELTNLFNYYNLRGINGKPIFYNRRFTENQIPSKEADELVKDFIEKFKTHGNEILKSFGYEEFKKNVITTRTDRSLDLEEKYDIIVEELNNKLADKNFIKTIIQILINYRYKDMYTLINTKK